MCKRVHLYHNLVRYALHQFLVSWGGFSAIAGSLWLNGNDLLSHHFIPVFTDSLMNGNDSLSNRFIPMSADILILPPMRQCHLTAPYEDILSRDIGL